MQISEPSSKSREPTPFLRLGFRPFYFGASLFAVLVIPLWLLSYLNFFPSVNINIYWHIHEMVFGFCMAVVVGFLFTAARNWTGLWTPRGIPLALFATLWLAGRISMATCSTVTAAALDLPFIPAAAYVLAKIMIMSGKKRNLPLIGILALLFLCNLSYHLSVLGISTTSTLAPLHTSLLLIALLSTVMGTRVIPGFTAAATSRKTSQQKHLDLFAFLSIAACFTTSVIGAPGSIVLVLSIVGATAHISRMRCWGTFTTRRHPLLWILHLSFIWMGIGILLLGISAWSKSSPSGAFHVLSVSAIASLIVGMMARTTRGHTGQKMTSSRAEAAAFFSIQLAGLFRLWANFCSIELRTSMLTLSGLLWCLTFSIFLSKFGISMFHPRIDGREG